MISQGKKSNAATFKYLPIIIKNNIAELHREKYLVVEI